MKLSRLTLLLALGVLFATTTQAQRRFEPYYTVGLGVGSTNYSGDLINAVAQGYDENSFPYNQLATLGNFGYTVEAVGQYVFHPNWRARAGLTYSNIEVTDDLDYRALDVQIAIFELSANIVYDFVGQLRQHRFRPKFSPYVFTGVNIFTWRPTATVAGFGDLNLRPLRTEAQDSEYGDFAIAIPFGIGFRYAISDRFDLSLEIVPRWTTTDYLDDVSGSTPAALARGGIEGFYPLPSALDDDPIRIAASFRGTPGNEVDLRGSQEANDWYINSTIRLNYILGKNRQLVCPPAPRSRTGKKKKFLGIF